MKIFKLRLYSDNVFKLDINTRRVIQTKIIQILWRRFGHFSKITGKII